MQWENTRTKPVPFQALDSWIKLPLNPKNSRKP